MYVQLALWNTVVGYSVYCLNILKRDSLTSYASFFIVVTNEYDFFIMCTECNFAQ